LRCVQSLLLRTSACTSWDETEHFVGRNQFGSVVGTSSRVYFPSTNLGLGSPRQTWLFNPSNPPLNLNIHWSRPGTSLL
jgi:hypothetical protein